jgi:hypothetical protein
MDIYDMVAREHPETAAERQQRPVPERSGETPLDKEAVVLAAAGTVLFEQHVAQWGTPQTCYELLDVLHEFELERAAKPPVINVSVTPPDGFKAMEGHFRFDTTQPQQAAYVVGPPPEPERRAARLTRKVRRKMGL